MAASAQSAYPLQLLADFNNGVGGSPNPQPPQVLLNGTPNVLSGSNATPHATPTAPSSSSATTANANAVTAANNAAARVSTNSSLSSDPWMKALNQAAAKAALPPGSKSPLEPYRAQIEERTRNGESCEQIAAALIAQGVQTSDKSVSRYRIMWGFRRRAVRKQTKPPKPAHLRSRAIHDAEFTKRRAAITHMTEQGLTAEEIARVMASRGMVLSKGVSTILRLQSRWGLRTMSLKDQRGVARAKARRVQEKEFAAYAKELGVAEGAERDQWVKDKIATEVAAKKREEMVKQLMGDAWVEPRGTTRKPSEKSAAGKVAREKTKNAGGGSGAGPAAATATPVSGGKTKGKGKRKEKAAESEMDLDTDAEADAQLVEESSRVLRPRASDATRPIAISDNSDSDFDSDGASDYNSMPVGDAGGNDSDGDDFAPMMDPGALSPWPTSPGPASMPRPAEPRQQMVTPKPRAPPAAPQTVASPKHTSAMFTLAPLGPEPAACPPTRKKTPATAPIHTADSFVAAARKLRDLSDAYVAVAENAVPGVESTARDISEARTQLKEALMAMMGRFPELR